MARIRLDEVKALFERTKMDVQSLDTDLLALVETEVLQRLAIQIDPAVSVLWVDPSTTPDLIRTIIAKKYGAWIYQRQYSEDVGTSDNTYADKLDANAEMLITGILDGSIIVDGYTEDVTTITFYPNDASSAQDLYSDPNDPSVGPASFSMGSVF